MNKKTENRGKKVLVHMLFTLEIKPTMGTRQKTHALDSGYWLLTCIEISILKFQFYCNLQQTGQDLIMLVDKTLFYR